MTCRLQSPSCRSITRASGQLPLQESANYCISCVRSLRGNSGHFAATSKKQKQTRTCPSDPTAWCRHYQRHGAARDRKQGPGRPRPPVPSLRLAPFSRMGRNTATFQPSSIQRVRRGRFRFAFTTKRSCDSGGHADRPTLHRLWWRVIQCFLRILGSLLIVFIVVFIPLLSVTGLPLVLTSCGRRDGFALSWAKQCLDDNAFLNNRSTKRLGAELVLPSQQIRTGTSIIDAAQAVNATRNASQTSGSQRQIQWLSHSKRLLTGGCRPTLHAVSVLSVLIASHPIALVDNSALQSRSGRALRRLVSASPKRNSINLLAPRRAA